MMMMNIMGSKISPKRKMRYAAEDILNSDSQSLLLPLE